MYLLLCIFQNVVVTVSLCCFSPHSFHMPWLYHQRSAPSLSSSRLHTAHSASMLIFRSTNCGEQAATQRQPRVLRKAGLLLVGMLHNRLVIVGEIGLWDFWIHDLSELKLLSVCESSPSTMADLLFYTVRTTDFLFCISSAFPRTDFPNSLSFEGCYQVFPTWHPFPLRRKI